MYIYMYIHTYIYIHTHAYIYIHTHTYTWMPWCSSNDMYTYIQTYIHTLLHIQEEAVEVVETSVCLCAYKHVYSLDNSRNDVIVLL